MSRSVTAKKQGEVCNMPGHKQKKPVQKQKKSGKIVANNNGKTVWELALNSVKSSKMRNFFIVVTITLSVSLLMVMSLFYAGLNTENARQVADMQHVVYYGLDREQIEEFAQDKRTEYVLGMKRGQSMEVDGKMVQPISYDSKPEKAAGVNIKTVTPVKGKEPQKIDEVMLSDVHCKTLGLKGEPGEKVSFTFLDGTTEEFVLSGIYHVNGSPKLYSIMLSQEYGEHGSQLKDMTYDGIVRIHNADKMSQSEFLDAIRTLGADYQVERKNINENNFFLNTLSGGDLEMQQTIMVVCVAVGILFVSVLVIYSVFYLAVIGRIQQFGQLRTIGMTKKQIRRMVRYEGMVLCSIGIPAGLLIGSVISYFIKPGGWSWKNTALIGICVIAADIITVLLSIRKPAVIASMISPVEASKFSGVEEKRNKQKAKKSSRTKNNQAKNNHSQAPRTVAASKKLYRKITPVSMASMNRSRNKKKTILTMVSLGIGGVLFMLAAFFTNATDLEGYARQGSYQYGEFVINLSYNLAETAEHGYTDIQVDNPINEELEQKVKSIDGVEKLRIGKQARVLWEANGENSEDNMASFSKKETDKLKSMLEEGSIDYDSMMKDDTVLIQYNDVTEEVYGWRYKIGDKVKLTWYDGQKETEKEFTIAGILDTDEYIDYSNNFADFILPEEKLSLMTNGMNLNSELIVKVDQTKQDQIEKQLDAVLEEYPALTLGTLRELKEEGESSYAILNSVMIGLSLFIVAFSILNMLNTLITNILTRKREFAMLQSVGMTTKQLSRMIQSEGLMLTAGNLIITLVLGTGAGYAMIRILQYFGAYYMHFNFPWLMFFGYAVFTAIVPVVVSTVMIRGFQKEALVDRLR